MVRRNKFVQDVVSLMTGHAGTMPMSQTCVAVSSHRINKSMNLLLYSVKSFPHCQFGRIFGRNANHSLHRIKRS